jgi:bacteriochlorophyllide a dehydrogenase
MGYPLVPGYESVGHVVQAGAEGRPPVGETVFVPGANCFGERARPVRRRGLAPGRAGRRAGCRCRAWASTRALLALAATAYHAVSCGGIASIRPPDLIVGHGVLGRLLARLNVAAGNPTTVWETDARRSSGAEGYASCTPMTTRAATTAPSTTSAAMPASLDSLIGRLAKGGEIVLAGFYSERISFNFAARLHARSPDPRRRRVAAPDLLAVQEADPRPPVARRPDHPPRPADHASTAYRTAFGDAACLKMILDWRHHA